MERSKLKGSEAPQDDVTEITLLVPELPKAVEVKATRPPKKQTADRFKTIVQTKVASVNAFKRGIKKATAAVLDEAPSSEEVITKAEVNVADMNKHEGQVGVACL